MVPEVGLLHYQALDIHGVIVYMYTADNQFHLYGPKWCAQRWADLSQINLLRSILQKRM